MKSWAKVNQIAHSTRRTWTEGRVLKRRCLARTADKFARQQERSRERGGGERVIRSVTSQLALVRCVSVTQVQLFLCRLQLTARPELRPELRISMVCAADDDADSSTAAVQSEREESAYVSRRARQSGSECASTRTACVTWSRSAASAAAARRSQRASRLLSRPLSLSLAFSLSAYASLKLARAIATAARHLWSQSLWIGSSCRSPFFPFLCYVAFCNRGTRSVLLINIIIIACRAQITIIK